MNKKVKYFVTCPIYISFWGLLYTISLLSGISFVSGCSSITHPAGVSENEQRTDTFDGINQTSMFDGENLGSWKPSDFWEEGRGKVYVKDGCLILEKGTYMTGVTWTGPVIPMNYEVSFEAMRVEGDDFFCGFTFPVGKDSCSLILGGWGNTVCGLSSIDDKDASLNATTVMRSLDNNRWYKIDLQVVLGSIRAWLDDELLIDIDTTGRKIDIRLECIYSQPLGFATYTTTGVIRNIQCYAME
jgi:hypothetical protein